jgi:DNA-binding beta-propeller fold protein YncE
MVKSLLTTRARRTAGSLVLLASALAAGAANALLGACGPFTDAAADSFCPFVLEIFYLGITTGTTPTTYDPSSNVSRLQMAAFLSRTVDSALKRGNRRAAMDQFWTTQNATVLGVTTVGTAPGLVASDGADIWVANTQGASVSRVRGSDGRLLETWTGATSAFGIVPAMGRVFATGVLGPGSLYRIDPSQPAGAVTTVASNLGAAPIGIAFDGTRLWTANQGSGGSVSIVTPGATIPWTVTTVTAGFGDAQEGIVFDGANIWTTQDAPGRIYKLDSAGAILLTVTVGDGPRFPAFDGNNIWVPTTANTVSVIRPSSGAILATLTGNGLDEPKTAAFDGQRLLVTNFNFGGPGSVSLWKAADLTPIGTFPTGPAAFGACSDGIAFWITFLNSNTIARF